MAKIFKIEGYYVDPNGGWSAEDLQIELEQNYDLIDKHIKVLERDIGEWEDDNPLNYYDSPESECEKYFSGAVQTETVKYCEHRIFLPASGICCGLYSKIKGKDGKFWAHFPVCTAENCPMLHSELLKEV